jgi:hypothetical protein
MNSKISLVDPNLLSEMAMLASYLNCLIGLIDWKVRFFAIKKVKFSPIPFF